MVIRERKIFSVTVILGDKTIDLKKEFSQLCLTKTLTYLTLMIAILLFRNLKNQQ
jgi:hypothetical protein